MATKLRKYTLEGFWLLAVILMFSVGVARPAADDLSYEDESGKCPPRSGTCAGI
jgi:hypothetical protein